MCTKIIQKILCLPCYGVSTVISSARVYIQEIKSV